MELEIKKLNSVMSKDGSPPHHIHSVKRLEQELVHLQADLLNKRLVVEKAERRLFFVAKRYVAHFQFLKSDFIIEFISLNDYIRRLKNFR